MRFRTLAKLLSCLGTSGFSSSVNSEKEIFHQSGVRTEWDMIYEVLSTVSCTRDIKVTIIIITQHLAARLFQEAREIMYVKKLCQH